MDSTKKTSNPILQGAVTGSLVTTTVYLVFLGVNLRTGLGYLPDTLITLVVGGLTLLSLALIIWLLLQILRFIGVRPAMSYPLILASGMTFIGFLYAFDVPLNTAVPLGLALVLAQVALGMSVGIIIDRQRYAPLLPPLLIFGLVTDILISFLLIYPGPLGLPLDLEISRPTELDNPATPGPYEIERYFYGSGTDLHRLEFGSQTDQITDPVDITPFLHVNGISGFFRETYWGFDLSQTPLNGRVWAPRGDGPFPLVLIVHGNDLMTEPADTGYDYLGELLGSRGYIFVSVDENFFNAYLGGPLQQDNDARALILLEHLQLWKSWNEDPGSKYYRRVDMEQVGLIGHSRGGEAAVIAAYFADLERSPDDPAIEFNYDVDIRTVIGIAPSVGSYRPGGETLVLENTNYLLLQGSHDADTSSNWGAIQLDRIHFNDDRPWVKSEIYVHRANHGQFNAVWGRIDTSLPVGWFLNTRPLLESEEQQQLAKVFISAFLDATLKEEWAYREFFRQPERASAWLPETLIVNQYSDSSYRSITDFEVENLPDILEKSGLVITEVEDLEYRYGGSQLNQVLHIEWALPKGILAIGVPQNLYTDRDSVLTLNLHNLRRYDPEIGTLDFSIEIVDQNEERAQIAISEHVTVIPPFEVQFTKWPPLEVARYGSPREAVLQTLEFPLSLFDGIDPSGLQQIRFLFNRTSMGGIYLDNIGFLNSIP